MAEAERRLSVVNELEATVEANLKRAERLRQSILERAFRGQLVPQDPHEEPASDLLTRIHARREGEKMRQGHCIAEPAPVGKTAQQGALW